MPRPFYWLLALLAASAALASAHPIVAGFERFHARAHAPAATAAGGLLLLNELNCVACHAAPPAWREALPGRGKILLSGVSERLSPEAIANFVRDPPALKPGTLMPQITGARSAAADRVLVAYLMSLASTAPPPKSPYPVGNAARGKRLFESVGCIACHGTPDLAATYPSVPLGLAPHYERNALAAFLQDPLRLRPAGRMPGTELTKAEAADLAEFLGAKAHPSAPPPSAPAEIAAGRAEFAARQCMSCHDTGDKHADRAATPLARLRADQGCLTTQPAGGTPRFNLNSTQTEALAAAVRRVQTEESPAPPTATGRVSTRFEQLNCYACHEWRGQGGAEAARARLFTARDSVVESIGELGRIPPNLDHAGRKLTSAWLEKLLWGSGGGVRPYMSVRMPRFGRESSADLIPLLAEACRPDQPLAIDTSGGKGHQRFATGRTLIGTGTGGIGCVTCHGIKDREPQGIRTINLTHTAQRLQPEFFKALLLDPQQLQPGTIMPPLLAGRPAAENEIESIWTYFKELDQSPLLPEGLAVAGSFELKPAAENRVIVFRTFLEGAGTQAVAVGTPAGVHAAFDAFEVRWAIAWRGRFLDAQSNWEERPMKPIKPLGTDVQRFSPHMPLAELGAANATWPTTFGRQAEYVFKGYRLEPDGAPTFRYAVSGLMIEDTLRPSADGNALQRRVVVRGSGEGWFFRALAPGSLPQPLVWKNGTAVLEEVVRFQALPMRPKSGSHSPFVVPPPGGRAGGVRLKAGLPTGKLITLFVSACVSLAASSAELPKSRPSYTSVAYAPPAGVKFEVTGIARLPDGRVAVALRKGEVWLLRHPDADPADPAAVGYQRIASGLHEALGLAWHDGALYTMQRSELTRLRDLDGDDVIDDYECAAKGWGVSGNYHEYAYGPVADLQGNLWFTLNATLGGGVKMPGHRPTDNPWRGWAMRLTPARAVEPMSAGFRSPSGLGMNHAGDIFATDQQGNWWGTNPLLHVRKGAFFGHKASLIDVDRPESPVRHPGEIVEGVTVAEAAQASSGYTLPAVWLPYPKLGQSATGIACDVTGGKFGPFANQLFIGEFTFSWINRVFLEKVGGEYQGAAFRFLGNLQCGPIRLEFLPDGSLLSGETNRGWNSSGTRSFGLERIRWTGVVPFEVREMRAQSDGFILEFTKPVDPRTAADPASYTGSSFSYTYQQKYGSPEIDPQPVVIASATLLPDGSSVRLRCTGLRERYVHELHVEGVRSHAGEAVVNPVGYYTLNRLPAPRP